jgi:hypothetical protein
MFTLLFHDNEFRWYAHLSDAKVFFHELYLGGVLFVSRLEVGIHFADAFDTKGVHCFLQMLTEVGVVNVAVFVGGGVM